MSGIFNTGLEFWQIIVAIVVMTLSIVTIKVAISFNLNEFLERRDKNNLIKIKNACPHFALVMLEGREFEVRSLFYKPFGTLDHICRQCGLQTALDMEQHERQANYYVKYPEILAKEQEKLTSLAKKSGKISK